MRSTLVSSLATSLIATLATTKTNTVGDPSVKNEKLPQTGEMDILLVGVGAALALVVVGLFIKVKLMDNQMKH